jgi:lysyl-tRNA synthetase class 1
VTDAERSQLMSDLESVVARRSNAADPKQFDPHQTRDAANRLIKQYRKTSASADVRRLQEVIGRAFEHFASLGNAMLASSILQTAVNAYRDAGLSQESQRVRVLLEDRIAASHAEMKPITVERLIPNEDMEKFLRSIIRPDIGETFALISIQFLESRKKMEQHVTDLQTEAPLMATITQQIVADRHIAGMINSVAEDPLGRLIQQTARVIPFSDVWLINALHRAIEIHNLTPEHFVGWAAQTELFDDLTLLMEGATAYFGQDFVKTVHVLIPQIESALRSLVSKLGRPTTKAHPAISGVSVVLGMGDILYPKGSDTEIIDALGPDITLHFLALYADPRGFNLRNDLAHGLLRADGLHVGVASRVIHTLLLLGIWDQIAARSKRS